MKRLSFLKSVHIANMADDKLALDFPESITLHLVLENHVLYIFGEEHIQEKGKL